MVVFSTLFFKANERTINPRGKTPYVAVIQAYWKRDTNHGGKGYHISIKIMKVWVSKIQKMPNKESMIHISYTFSPLYISTLFIRPFSLLILERSNNNTHIIWSKGMFKLACIGQEVFHLGPLQIKEINKTVN